MANTTLTIVWNPSSGSASFNPPAGVTNMRSGDTVTLRLTGGSSGGSIDTVSIFGNQVSAAGEDSKGSRICGWTRSGSDDCSVYQIAAVSDTEVTITDVDHPQADEKYWFSASGAADGRGWSVDPELINKPDT